MTWTRFWTTIGRPWRCTFAFDAACNTQHATYTGNGLVQVIHRAIGGEEATRSLLADIGQYRGVLTPRWL